MRFDLSSDSIQFIFFIFVLIVSFLGPKIKNLFESIENEQSHEPQRKTPQLAPRQSAGSKLKNRGANYREAPARSAVANFERSNAESPIEALEKLRRENSEVRESVLSEIKPETEALPEPSGAVLLQEIARDRNSLARAVIMSEILDKPLALRESKRYPF